MFLRTYRALQRFKRTRAINDWEDYKNLRNFAVAMDARGLICTCKRRLLSSDVSQDKTDSKIAGYAEAYEKFETINEPPKEELQTFARLLRNSKFIDLGDPENKVVTGEVFHVVGDDLYIDFGWKFHCVCPRPKNNGSYIRGAKVRLRIKELELSSKFLGYERDLTLLEADCILLGLSQEPR